MTRISSGSFGLGAPTGIKMAFYAVPLIPAVVGVVLIALGIFIIVEFKNRDGE